VCVRAHTRMYSSELQISVEKLDNSMSYKVKVKQSRYRPGGFQEVKVPRFHDNGTGWW